MRSIILLLVSVSLWSSVSKAKVILDSTMNSEAVQKMMITGVDANVVFIQSATPGFSIEQNGGTEGLWTANINEGVLTLEQKVFSTKKDLKESLNLAPAKVTLIVNSVGVPAELHLRSGSVTTQQWNSDLRLQMTQGKIVLNKVTGAVKINLQKGDLTASDLQGKTSVDLFQGSVTGKNWTGDGVLNLFNSQSQLDKLQGQYFVQSQMGSLKLNNSTGNWQIDNGKTTYVVQNHKGRFEGSTQDGSLQVQVLADSEINLKSMSGKIQLQLPAASGAWVNLLTQDGEINVPAELRVQKSTAEKTVKGRLKGTGEAKAHVTVRSQEGHIFLK